MLVVPRLPVFKSDLLFIPGMRKNDIVWELVAGEVCLIESGGVEEAHRRGVANLTAKQADHFQRTNETLSD